MKYEIGDLVWFINPYNKQVKKGLLVREMERDEIVAVVGLDPDNLHKYVKEKTYIVRYLGEDMAGMIRGDLLNKLEG